MTPDSNLIVVIRSAGERTTNLCHALVAEQVHPSLIHIVSATPFEAALRQAYRLGAESQAQWTFTLDADVLLAPGAVGRLLAAAKAMPPHYAQIEGRILDKTFGTHRHAGNRIYRSSILHLASRLLPANGAEIRPESAVLNRLANQGHPSRWHSEFMGVHDYEQGFHDLYRKSYIHGRKHSSYAESILRRSLQLSASDQDHAVIVRGFLDGLAADRPVGIDASLLQPEAAAAVLALGLSEKPTLDHLSALPNLRHFIQTAAPPPCIPHFHDNLGQAVPKRPPSRSRRLRELYAQHGLFRTSLFVTGTAFLRVAHLLRR
jgi:hypothetical protein